MVVDSTPRTGPAPHVLAASDSEGFAAVGVVATLVLTYDVVQGVQPGAKAPED
ncbi:hypothetical protein ABZ719_23565 [Streptomyces sp. NPDC006743]|uniref:hypothetical protein n=1 Tax=Streptomyces sp. NPDC006743 TaxID=3154480 RepID=UPI003454DA00